MQYVIGLKDTYILGNLLPPSPVYKITLIPWIGGSRFLQNADLYLQNYEASYSRGLDI